MRNKIHFGIFEATIFSLFLLVNPSIRAGVPGTNDSTGDDAEPRAPILSEKIGDAVQRSVYEDVYSIFLESNNCSRFFGGENALEVVNGLSSMLTRKNLNDPQVGMMMTGTYSNFKNMRTGFTYRLFEKNIINADGPFYHEACSTSRECSRRIGSFLGFTREGRALMMLHELAHLMKGADGKWLIPDDGKSERQSEANTSKVEDNCSAQIRQLASTHFTELLAARKASTNTEAALKNRTNEDLTKQALLAELLLPY